LEDLSQFKQTYFDECAELLTVAENGLLQVTPGPVDSDTVNAIFRAVHSIKGGAGAFGFTELVAFAHEYETVMDGVRSDTIPVTPGLIDALFSANDILARLVAHARDETAPNPEPVAAAVELLHANAGGSPQQAGANPPNHTATPGHAAGGAAAGNGSALQHYTIRFHPSPELLLTGNEPAFILRSLARLGEARIVCRIEDVPLLGDLEPELLFLSWTIELVTGAGLAEIQDVFEFVSDDGSVDILPLGSAAPPILEVGAAGADQTAPTPLSTPAEAAPAVAGDAGPTLPATAAGAGASPPALLGSDERNAAERPGERAAPRPTANGRAGGDGFTGLGSHTIRVDLDKIDRLVNMVGEMVITQAMIAEHVRELPPGEFQELLEGLEQLAQHTRELRESVMSIRAQPVGSVFQRMPRLVRELAAETGKDIVLETSGEATEVDKTVIENLVDPLTHMIRNSIDHGIERPDEREAAGKPRTGKVHLSAQHRSGRIVIEVSDDGHGIDRPRVLRKAIERGLMPENANPSDEEIDNLIFLPGFSTADAVSNISGRGVGMDVVRRNITGLGGRIGVHSSPGQGSRFVLSLPLTLAVLDGMVISVGAERFVLPLTNIVESLRPKPADLHGLVNLCDVIMARGQYVRLVYLGRLFGIPDAVSDATKGLVVLVETEDGRRLGLVVDEVLGQQQVVIKSMETNYRRLDGVAAATILGDGRVALILDVAGLQDMSQTPGGGGKPATLNATPELPAVAAE